MLLLWLSKVEGEIDKLSVEEAGFRNCVSVPGGAPQIVSVKDLPSMQKVRIETDKFLGHVFVVRFNYTLFLSFFKVKQLSFF